MNRIQLIRSQSPSGYSTTRLPVTTLCVILTIVEPAIGLSETNLGTWNILNIKYAFNKKVSMFGEG